MDDLRCFLQLARAETLTQSALILGVSQSTIARRIATLEQDLNVILFTRHQTGYFLTEPAKDIMKYAEEVEAKILNLQLSASTLKEEVTGVVRLATTENIATAIIIPALSKLYQKYSKLRLEVITSIGMVGFLKHEVDIALRFSRPEQNNLLVRHVTKIPYGLFAHKNYLMNFTKPFGHDLNRYHFITWDKNYDHLPSAKWLTKTIPDPQSILVTTSIAAQLAATKMALGVVVLPHFLIKNNADLVNLAERLFSDDLWLVSYAELRTSKNIRAVIDFIIEEVNQQI